MGWWSFSQIWFNLEHLPKIFNLVWSKGKLLHTLFQGFILYHVKLNTYSSFSRLNTRFTSPQTCHMLPLDQFKHRSNSGTIQASNSFYFHEWAYKTWGMTRYTKHILSKRCMHANQLLPWIAQRRGMSYNWGCINTYLRNPICSTHSLACKTFSHPMAWWIYSKVDLRCPHSQYKYPLFIDDLLWNGGEHQCALFLHVEPFCWWAW
jgi:hypothetical protein